MLVAIVGAGPTGLTAANLLGQAGIQTLLLERNANVSDFPRAITLDDEGMRICQALGLHKALSTTMLLDIQAHYLSRGHYLAKVAPTDNNNGYPLISTFHQPEFEARLLAGLARFACVELRFGHTIEKVEQTEQAVRLSIRTPEDISIQILCDYVLACDGGKSTLRQALGIQLRQPGLYDLFPRMKKYISAATKAKDTRLVHKTPTRSRQRTEHTQQWLVVDCSHDDDPTHAAIFFCNPARPAVTVPAPHANRRWEFMLLADEHEESLLNDDSIQALIKQARLTQPPETYTKSGTEQATIIRKTVYTFHATLASTFSRGRIFLLGDAAHLMPPFGGQGMNSGLRDAYNLCWKLVLVVKGQASKAILETYEQERLPHVAQMILFSALLGNLVMPTRHLPALLRDIFFRTIDMLPLLRRQLTEMRVKPQPRYTQGFLLPTTNKTGKKLIGRMLPQPPVMTMQGEKVLFDEVLGDGFALLRLSSNPDTAFATIKEGLWERLKVRYICILPARQKKQKVQGRWSTVIDIEGKIGAFLGANQDIYILVRPDRYVMGVFQVEQTEQAARLLRDLSDLT